MRRLRLWADFGALSSSNITTVYSLAPFLKAIGNYSYIPVGKVKSANFLQRLTGIQITAGGIMGGLGFTMSIFA